MMRRASPAFVVLLALSSFACSSPPAGDEHPDDHDEAGAPAEGDEHDEEGEEGAAEGALHLEGVRGVRFATVEAPREEGAWFAAEAVSDAAGEAALSTPVSGIVGAIRVAPGANVAKGAAVLDLTSAELADLQAAWRAARARREQAEAERERERRLLAAGATAQRDVEAAEAAASVGAAEEEAARLALAGRGVEPGAGGATFVVRAPRAGVVSALDVALGQNVEAGRELGRIVAPGAAIVRVELPLPGPDAWAPGATTRVRRADGREWTATVEGTPPELSAATRRLVYRLRLAAASVPLPLAGTPLEARVPLATAIVLPQTALQQIEGVWGVFVRTGEEAAFRPVRKGAELGGDVMVLEGVSAGETVATDGAYLLKALWLKRAGGGGHHDH